MTAKEKKWFGISERRSAFLPRVPLRWLDGHVTMGRLTIYGRNAMHWAVNYRRKRGDYVCFRLPFTTWGYWYSLYFYVSPDGTPASSTFYLPKRHRKWL